MTSEMSGIFPTFERQIIGTTQNAGVLESNGAVYAESSTQWLEHVQTTLGLREDQFDFDVKDKMLNPDGSCNINSDPLGCVTGTKRAAIFSPEVGPHLGTLGEHHLLHQFRRRLSQQRRPRRHAQRPKPRSESGDAVDPCHQRRSRRRHENHSQSRYPAGCIRTEIEVRIGVRRRCGCDLTQRRDHPHGYRVGKHLPLQRLAVGGTQYRLHAGALRSQFCAG